jgi:RNA recognition motif-containing protein
MSSRTRLYVGKVSNRTREGDLRDLFSKYGHIRHVDVKYGFAFVVCRCLSLSTASLTTCTALLVVLLLLLLISALVGGDGDNVQEFESARDADEAVRRLDDYELDGSRLIVEFSRGSRGERRRDRRSYGMNDCTTRCIT